MSSLNHLIPKRGSVKRAKVIGRGRGSGHGQTSTKGHKGQKARTGGRVRRGFEGGQTPLFRRTPKFGFKNTKFQEDISVVNISQLEKLSGEITPEKLVQAGLALKNTPVKVLGHGEIKKALTVRAHKFSEKAKSAIESAGGKAEVI